MKKKQIIALLLALILVFSCCACDAETGQANNNGSTGDSENSSSVDDTSEPILNADGIEVHFDDIDDSIVVEQIEWFREPIVSYTAPSGSQAKKTPEGTIIFGTSGNIQGAYPVTNQQENVWCFNVYESLFQRNYVTGEIDPWLATDYYYDDDGNFHITLREGVKFHDGNTMTAEDVLYTLKLSYDDPKARAYTIMQNIDFENSVIEDDYHLTLAFKSHIGSILDVLASGYCSIMSKEFVESVGEDYPYLEADAGTGAYYLVETVTDISQTFKRFDGYWGDAPEVETVVCKKYNDETVMFIDFLNGELDFSFRTSYDDVLDILAGEYTDLTLFRLPVNRYKYVYFNTNDEDSPCTDLRVRQAIAYCIDYDALSYAVYGSDAIADGQMTSCFMPGISYQADIGKYEYNPELSKQLLAEAGYGDSNPCVLSLVCGSNNNLDAIGELIQYYCREVGIEVSVDVLKSSALKDNTSGLMKDSPYDLVVNTGDFGNGSPTGLLSTRDAYGREEGEYNPLTGIISEELHETYMAAEAAETEEARAELYKDIQQMFFDNVWSLNTLMDAQLAVGHSWLQNYTFSSAYTFRWATWTIAE